ncbi:endonuclease/exonuclease/phosphatase family protein [Butyrivibrio sp. MC2021]|uniref:endonuclease/exonuclease/phosphatase family protein n=1 Tax=Butyrivibrio sp. MC2021 TaxID=1408306 RepID=UPI0006879DA4|nr:endonuclease/exonuclease/phosphatase family protein [Butyrivibrio sp. MC2021]
MNKVIKKVLQAVLLTLLLLVLLAGTLGAYLTVDEYKPEEVEKLTPSGEKGDKVVLGKEYTIETWNVGYGALGDNADFFMDGGKMVNTATKERVYYNLDGMIAQINADDPDFLFLQELDRSSTRAHFVDELQYFDDNGSAGMFSGQNLYASNFRVAFLPYPIPPIGKVECGLGTFSSCLVGDAERVSLPCPYSWPVSTMNLKRCLMIARCPIEGTDDELVLINLHLEAYDDGSGKIAQTRMLKELMLNEINTGDYVIAGGDFNQIFNHLDYSEYPQLEGMWKPGVINIDDFGDKIDFYTGDNAPSCRSLDRVLETAASRDPKDFQYYLIDGFLVSSNISVNEIATRDIGFEYSDHNPIVMKFTLTEGNN